MGGNPKEMRAAQYGPAKDGRLLSVYVVLLIGQLSNALTRQLHKSPIPGKWKNLVREKLLNLLPGQGLGK